MKTTSYHWYFTPNFSNQSLLDYVQSETSPVDHASHYFSFCFVCALKDQCDCLRGRTGFHFSCLFIFPAQMMVSVSMALQGTQLWRHFG